MEIIVDDKVVNSVLGDGCSTSEVKQMIALSDGLAKIAPVVRLKGYADKHCDIIVEFPRFFDEADYSEALKDKQFEVVLMHYRKVHGKENQTSHAMKRRGWGVACGVKNVFHNPERYSPFVRSIDYRGSVVFGYEELTNYIIQRFVYNRNTAEPYGTSSFDEGMPSFKSQHGAGRWLWRKTFGLAFRYKDSAGKYRYSLIKEIKASTGAANGGKFLGICIK
jgi:hypothetical protein